MNYITEKSKFPTAEHYAALIFTSIWIEGDERSRTVPGHGYPAHSESVVNYIEFTSKEEMEQWVQKQEHPTYGMPQRNYKVMMIQPLNVSLSTIVTFQKP